MRSSFAIEVRDLTKTYGSGNTAYRALRGIDFTASPSEFVMLSGPSGSGKTTLLSVLGCVLTPTTGKVALLGEDVSHAKEKDLPRLRLSYIGFVFQSHNLIEALSSQDNIALVLELRGWSRGDARREAARLLESVDLPDKRDSKPRDLSGGQRQRVAIARALAGAPPILLADEPTAALDAHNGYAVTELLRKLAKDHGHTIVVVTHDSRIFHLADRIVYIEDGLIVEKPS
ncbi:MAG: ABC transporter ATP-binding protein [Polyangiaceae bacterium]|jgi:putative ABC transport system ATP-binding protein